MSIVLWSNCNILEVARQRWERKWWKTWFSSASPRPIASSGSIDAFTLKFWTFDHLVHLDVLPLISFDDVKPSNMTKRDEKSRLDFSLNAASRCEPLRKFLDHSLGDSATQLAKAKLKGFETKLPNISKSWSWSQSDAIRFDSKWCQCSLPNS